MYGLDTVASGVAGAENGKEEPVVPDERVGLEFTLLKSLRPLERKPALALRLGGGGNPVENAKELEEVDGRILSSKAWLRRWRFSCSSMASRSMAIASEGVEERIF